MHWIYNDIYAFKKKNFCVFIISSLRFGFRCICIFFLECLTWWFSRYKCVSSTHCAKQWTFLNFQWFLKFKCYWWRSQLQEYSSFWVMFKIKSISRRLLLYLNVFSNKAPFQKKKICTNKKIIILFRELLVFSLWPTLNSQQTKCMFSRTNPILSILNVIQWIVDYQTLSLVHYLCLYLDCFIIF